MTSAKLVKEALDREAPSIARDLGYTTSADLGTSWRRRSSQWWFARVEHNLETALLGFEYCSKPERSLIVLFLGSPMPLHQLLMSGISGNAAIFNLSQFQFYQLKREPAAILPPAISLNPPTRHHLNEVLQRVRQELATVHPAIWQHMRDAWAKERLRTVQDETPNPSLQRTPPG